MAKAKKISIRTSAAKGISFRLMDAVLLLLVGGFGSLSLYLYQDMRKDVNVLLQNEQAFKTQVAPALNEEINNLRGAIRDLNARLAIKKTKPTPLSPAGKGKRHALSENAVDSGSEAPSNEQGISSNLLNIINRSYVSIDGKARIWDSRAPASVSNEDQSKNLRWVAAQIGLCFSWMLVIGAIVLLILKLVDPSSRSNENNNDQF